MGLRRWLCGMMGWDVKRISSPLEGEDAGRKAMASLVSPTQDHPAAQASPKSSPPISAPPSSSDSPRSVPFAEYFRPSERTPTIYCQLASTSSPSAASLGVVPFDDTVHLCGTSGRVVTSYG
ncbi:hypothetical protein ACLOJK_026582 [Asimina triloba]